MTPSPAPPRRPGPRDRLRRMRQGSSRWVPVAVLLLTLGLASAAILEARRAAVSDHDTTRALVRGHGAVAAWSFGRAAGARLDSAFAADLDAVEAGGDAGTASFRLPVRGAAAWRGEAAPAVRARVEAAVRVHPATLRPGRRFAVVQAGGRGGPLVVARATAGEGGAVVGFVVDPRRLAPLFAGVLAREPLLPPSLAGGRPTASLAVVHVLAPDGAVLFASPGELWEAGTTEPLGPRFGGMAVHASILQPAAYALILGDRAPSRLPLLVGLLALAFVTAAGAVVLLRRQEELVRVRSDFVSSVSHELRTPLAQIRLFLETLRLGRWRTEAQREWILDNIERESFRLAALVDNILLFSRTERGGAAGPRAPTPLAPFLEGLVREFAPLAALRRVTVETAIEPELCPPLDADAFRQVMLNLLDNAVKYGPAGQTVRIGARAEGDRVRIAVEDGGPGVPPHEREAVWAPFRRGGDAVGSAAAGSGIGLSVVREIVEWHGGTARVEASEGGGARFVLEIPGGRARVADAGRDALEEVR